MQASLSDTLLKILNVINYLDNKEKFVKEFEELNHTETILNILERLPKETQEKIKAIKDQQEAAVEIKKHIIEKEYVEELVKVSNSALLGFLKDIEHTLSVEQKQRIAELFQQE